MSIGELCLKSVDKPSKTNKEPIGIKDVLSILDKPTDYSEGLDEFIHSATSIMIIIDGNTPTELADHVVDACGSKLKYITSSSMKGHDILTKHADKIIQINRDDINQFNYYGVTSMKIPILLHKSVMDCNAVIVLSEVRYDAFIGYTGGVANIVVALSAKRTIDRLATIGADCVFYTKCDGLKPMEKALREMVITASAKVSWFGINYCTDTQNNIVDMSTGDIFLSKINLIERYNQWLSIELEKEYDCVLLDTDTKHIEVLIYQIANACSVLKDGCRLLVSAKNLGSFMQPLVMKYLNMPVIDDVYEAVLTDGGRDALFALHARKLGEQYHIAVDSKEQISELIKKCAWNPIKEDGYAEFVKNCEKIIDVSDVVNYAIR